VRKRVALAFRNTTKAPPYIRALETIGLEPVAFTPDAGLALGDLAGLVLTGGSDIDPALYEQAAQPECGQTDRARDDHELALLRAALARDLPVLAICRGMQLLNVARGGTLIQHLADGGKHKLPHEVVLQEPLISIFGTSAMTVNSRHHQAVDRLGEGLIVTARDPADGVVEGIALPEFVGSGLRPRRRASARRGACVSSAFSWVIGVQWHPEDMPDDPLQRRLFEKFSEKLEESC
jgi:gamma-glutamyl-gamma-aminobutyrate hydrolase PuuD